MASVDPKAFAPPSTSKKKRPPIRAQAEADNVGSLAKSQIASQPAKTSRTATLPPGETLAMLQPRDTGIQTPPANETIRVLDPEEIKLFTKQGEQFAEAGDFVTARTLFQRAAEAGDAAAALALGATYDPNVLAKVGAVGIGADVEKARRWYQKAASLGAPDAKRRLELLANR